MVQEPKSYRPRRAWVPPEDSDADAPTASNPPATPDPPASRPTPPPPAVRPTIPSQLFRDEDTASRAAISDSTRQAATPAPRTPQPRADRTRSLPAQIAPPKKIPTPTAASSTPAPRSSRAVDPDAIDEKRSPGQRAKLGLLIGAVAAITVVGLVVWYVAFGGRGAEAGPGDDPKGNPNQSTSTEPEVLLTDASMLTEENAKLIDGGAKWEVTLTQKGLVDGETQPACVPAEQIEGKPTPMQTVLRVLEAGKKDPAVLHQADAFANTEEATQAFALTATALGGCQMTDAYIQSGRTVSGLGDQAVGLVVKKRTDGNASEFHSLVLSRTGRVVNLVDVAETGKSVSMPDVASALGEVTNNQCKTANGKCATEPDAVKGPPPLGGDEPGFLATADIPPVGELGSVWTGTPQTKPDATGDGPSLCEGTNFDTVKGPENRSKRSYLTDDPTAATAFGIDETVLEMKSAKDARDLRKDVLKNIENCTDDWETAKVDDLEEFAGTGADEAKIDGATTTITQANGDGDTVYRVAVTSVGTKFIHTVLVVDGDFDLTNKEWSALAFRAAERASQTK